MGLRAGISLAKIHPLNLEENLITDIDEISIQEFIAECGEQLKEWDRKYGLRLFENLDSYAETLQNSRYKVWRVESAIGFWGLVVAREVKNT